MKEVWAEIEGFPNYAVSNYGFVVNLTTNKFVKGIPNSKGYLKVRLYRNRELGGAKELYIHQLVGKAFFGDYRHGIQIKHVNGDKDDNSVPNLQMRLGVRINGMPYDPNPPSGRASWGKRVRIVETGEVFRSVRDCARYINGDYTSIYKVLRGQRASHLGYSFEFYEE